MSTATTSWTRSHSAKENEQSPAPMSATRMSRARNGLAIWSFRALMRSMSRAVIGAERRGWSGTSAKSSSYIVS